MNNIFDFKVVIKDKEDEKEFIYEGVIAENNIQEFMKECNDFHRKGMNKRVENICAEESIKSY